DSSIRRNPISVWAEIAEGFQPFARLFVELHELVSRGEGEPDLDSGRIAPGRREEVQGLLVPGLGFDVGQAEGEGRRVGGGLGQGDVARAQGPAVAGAREGDRGPPGAARAGDLARRARAR